VTESCNVVGVNENHIKKISELHNPAGQSSDEYLTIKEVASRLKIKPKTVKNKMSAGVFRKGIHYFSRPGIGPRFKWSSVVAWLEQGEPNTRSEGSIPMARGYRLGEGLDEKYAA
jgi:hypothetical protein